VFDGDEEGSVGLGGNTTQQQQQAALIISTIFGLYDGINATTGHNS
jgi:hypothetical protein